MRALYSLEIRQGRRWFFIEARSTLRNARELRDKLYEGCVTRIRKWVLP